MTPPGKIFHVEWHEGFRDRNVERRYRSELRAARQVAAILAAPDEVSRLIGVWCSTGYDADRITWTEVDGREMVEAVSDALADEASGLDGADDLTPAQRRDAVAASWDHYEESA